jgi:putative transcriptional regulator
MSEVASLKNNLLIAMPTLEDPNFSHSVNFICEHSDEGAMGIMINRPLDVSFREVMEHMELEGKDEVADNTLVYLGGPIQPDRGFVLHEPLGEWDSTMQITEELGLTTSRDIVASIAQHEGPERYLIALGYAGWGAGQLEEELTKNSWLSVPATSEILFETAHELRWEAAAAILGVDVKNLSHDIGHA